MKATQVQNKEDNKEQNCNNLTDAEEFYKERINSKNHLLKEYKNKFDKSCEFEEFIKKYENLENGSRLNDEANIESVMGKILKINIQTNN